MFRTRIAPSPTGMFHLGTARTAYFNWLAARATGGRFILRIDDTDEARNTQEAVDVILDSMKWLGLDWDELYFQSDRRSLHLEAADLLLKADRARIVEGGAVALNMPELPPSWKDRTLGDVTISDDLKTKMEPIILVRSDGAPTYQLASIVDDFYMGVNWIIRGQEHIHSTAMQLAIWKQMSDHEFPACSHIGLIFKDGKKLSKRDDAASLLWYREQGYLPETILAFVLRMGWAPRNEDKSHRVIDQARAVELFLAGGAMRGASQVNYDERRLDFLQSSFEGRLGVPRDQWLSTRKKAQNDQSGQVTPSTTTLPDAATASSP